MKYVLMPEVLPRLKKLFASGFGYIAFLMAQIYGMVRLLPPGHPYLNPQNMGRFGIHHVVVESSNSIVFSRKNIDQILVFIIMLSAIIIMALQVIVLLLSVLFGTAFAGSIFLTANPDNDIAFMLLDQVFGVGNGSQNFFNSCVSSAALCANEQTNAPFPWPFHMALHNMFRFYSLAILIVGTVIFLYFVMVVILETATSGSPFGQRFQNVWVPVRLVVALGLLVPLGYGYNSGQYVTFFAAKYGSGFATNAWLTYNNAVNSRMEAGRGNPLGERENMIAMPKPPDASSMSEFMSLAHSCAFAEYLYNPNINKEQRAGQTTSAEDIDIPYPDSAGRIGTYLSNRMAVKPWFVKNPAQWQTEIGGSAAQASRFVSENTTYQEAMDFFTGGDIVITFGYKLEDGDPNAAKYTGGVIPTCGEIRVPISDRRETDANNVHATDGYIGTVAVQRLYFDLVRDLWFSSAAGPGGVGLNENYIDFAGRMALLYYNPASNSEPASTPCAMGCSPVNPNLPSGGCGGAPPGGANPDRRECTNKDISARWKQDAINTLQVQINTEIAQIWRDYNTQTNEFDMDPAILEYGWGGAGIWFNTLARVNGNFVAALLDFPTMTRYPKVMEDVRNEKNKKDKDPSGIEQFNPESSTAGGEVSLGGSAVQKNKALVLYKVFSYWNKDTKNMANPEKVSTAGAIETGMNLIFGTYGLFAMTNENANIHPLAQLTSLGKGLVESAIRNIAGSSITAALGGITKAVDQQAGPLIEAVSSFLNSTAFVGLTAGLVLFYVLPFLPFLYFFFAVGSWVKTIFEAMVGVPLWALAHLRLDGEGLPGDAASNGYTLMLDVFLRPILTIAGLLAAMLIFTTQVRVLNFIWPLVTENVGGHNSDSIIASVGNIAFKRSIVDTFFYTAVYALICYMLATSCFKLIDKIPDDILRWIGGGVSSFGDFNQDPTENLTRYAALGGMTAGREAAGGIRTLAGGAGGAVGGELAKLGTILKSGP